MKMWLAGMLVGVAVVAAADDARITVYNQDFAVVRETIPLNVEEGTNRVSVSAITAHVEPDSVILRDPAGQAALRVLEQNYRADPVSQALLLQHYEGETIEFLVNATTGETVEGRIVRAGYVPHLTGMQRFGQAYVQRQMAMAYGGYMGAQGTAQPLIEVNGRLRFQLPGVPLFPALKDDSILKPTLDWVLESRRAGSVDAELSYVTGGMTWVADYNLIEGEHEDTVELVGWVTLDNQSGRTFENAHLRLMAGDVSKLVEQYGQDAMYFAREAGAGGGAGAAVTEKAFEDFHLYTLQRPTTLRDRETKQVEFIRAPGIESTRFYVYDGAKVDQGRWRGWDLRSLREQSEYGTESNTKVWIMREFENTEANNLGMPLPKGRMRFYKQESNQLEFVGENTIDHTPRGETVRAYVGNAFDLVGERKRTDFQIDRNQRRITESFEIALRNRKEEPVEIRVVEHLYRWHNWTLTAQSDNYTKTDSQTIEFPVTVVPDEEKTVTYTVEYTW